jgi:transposase
VSSVRAAFLPDMPPEMPPARAGRPRESDRDRRLRCARLVTGRLMSPPEAAAFFGLHLSTVYRWTDELMAEDSPDGDTLRKIDATYKKLARRR